MKLTNCEDVSDKDEITLYLRGRYLCSMDAMWRTLGKFIDLSYIMTFIVLIFLKINIVKDYQTYPAPNPSVRIIKIKTDNNNSRWTSLRFTYIL